MTSIADATRRAVARARSEPTSVSVRPYRPPVLSPELKRELGRALAGPLVLPGSGNGDAPLIVHPDLAWQPDAADAADDLRAGMSSPAARETVEQWLTTLAMFVVNAPTDPAAVEMQCAAVWRLCGQFPAAVWSDESLDAYCDADKYWPAPAALRQFLNGRVALMERQIAAFDRIATKGVREPIGPARASTDYLDSLIAAGTASVPPRERPAEEKLRPTDAKAAAAEADAEDPIEADDPVTVKARLAAAFGKAAFATDLLAARRKVRGQ